MASFALVIGRILMAIIFIVSGVNKLRDVEQTGAMISAAGLPAQLAMPTGIFELVAGAALAVGILSRIVPLLLAGFTLLTILYFHGEVSDPMQAGQAMKNLAIIGGLLAIFASGQQRRGYRVVETSRVRDEELDRAEDRAQAAELRAIRADGVNDQLGPDPIRQPWYRRWF